MCFYDNDKIWGEAYKMIKMILERLKSKNGKIFEYIRILWSPSPHATAELFDELKQGREQPDSSKAATIGVDIIDDINVDKYNPQIQDFLSKLPGISSKNIYAIMNHCENLLDLLEISEVYFHTDIIATRNILFIKFLQSILLWYYC